MNVNNSNIIRNTNNNIKEKKEKEISLTLINHLVEKKLKHVANFVHVNEII
jgi:hypothetical protein